MLTLKDFQQSKEEKDFYEEVLNRHKILIKILKDLEDLFFKSSNLKNKLLLAKEIRMINDSLEKYKLINKSIDIEIQKLLEEDKQLTLNEE